MADPCIDPVQFQREFWPADSTGRKVYLTKEQREICYSVLENYETIVPAGNMLGKDYIAGFIALWWFLSHPVVRVVTTSVKDDHLDILWGEIERWVQSAKYGLVSKSGLICNHHEIRKVMSGKECPISYLKGMVSAKGEGMSGHHADKTLIIMDEASGVDQQVYDHAIEWAKRILIIGNPNQCENFFRYGVEGKPGTDDRGGDLPRTGGKGYHRKIIRITAQDSPNVRLAEAQIAMGLEPTNEILVPGLLDWETYKFRRETWDAVQQAVKLDARFYAGAENLMFPPEWLDRAEEIAAELDKQYREDGKRRIARGGGCDPAEGGDKTSMSAVDELGLIDQQSKKTPDTAKITAEALGFMRQHRISPEDFVFDRGGGGKQHADRLREMGYKVRTVAFGESVSDVDKWRPYRSVNQRKGEEEERYEYKNRRAQLYGQLRELLDPSANPKGFGLPSRFAELRRQLAPIPLLYDREGRLYLPAKNRQSENSKEKTLVELIGHSPDEADSLVCAIFAMTHKPREVRAGAVA